MGKGDYYHLNLPAIATRDEIIPLTRGRLHARRIGDLLNPQRESQAVLDSLRNEMGPRAFEAQYQQNPVPTEGDHIQWEKVQFYDEAPPRERLEKVVLSWDTASSSDPRADYTVGTVWGHDGSSWLLLDVIRLRLNYPDLLPRVRGLREHWQADKILVEKACVGRVLLQDLTRDFRGLNGGRYQSHCAPIAIRPEGPKAERFFTSVERLYSGFARFPRDAPWRDDLKQELMAFPAGRHDDQVDSISQFLNWAVGRGGRTTLQGREARRDGPRPK